MALDLTIYQLVASNLPAGFVVSENYIDTRLKYWQLFLAEAAEIPEADIYNIDAWAALPDGDKWLILLSYCVTYDIYVLILSGKFISLGNTGEGEGETGEVKKIVTGPTEVEYHNSAEALAMLIKNIGGTLDSFLQLACAFAQQLGVKLPFCQIGYRANIIIGKKPLRGQRFFNYLAKKTQKGGY